jgi:hypothetical protein
MGLLNLFAKPTPTLVRLPFGSFTVDRDGRVLTGTLPSSFPVTLVKDIAEQVRAAFAEADTAHLPLADLVIKYPSLKISARELRGGAIVYLSPRAPSSPMKQS